MASGRQQGIAFAGGVVVGVAAAVATFVAIGAKRRIVPRSSRAEWLTGPPGPEGRQGERGPRGAQGLPGTAGDNVPHIAGELDDYSSPSERW